MTIRIFIYLIILFYLISKINCSDTSPINSKFCVATPYIFDKRCLAIFLEVYNLNFEVFSLSKRFNWILSEQAMLINADLFCNLRKMYAYLHKASRLYGSMDKFQELRVTNPFECSIGPLNNPTSILLENNLYRIKAEVDGLECACRCLRAQIKILEEINVGYCIFILEFILFILERAYFLLTVLEDILGFLQNILFYYFGVGDNSYINTHRLEVLLEVPGIIQDELPGNEIISILINYISTGDSFDCYSKMYYDADLSEFESRISRSVYLQHNMMCENEIKSPCNSDDQDSNICTSQKVDLVSSKVEFPESRNEEVIKKEVSLSPDSSHRRGRSRRSRSSSSSSSSHRNRISSSS
ncbi:hypothetical protein cand_002210, partial [Cryptosporidium andersoni]